MINLSVERLKLLPQRRNETWQGGVVQLPVWITEEGPTPFRPVVGVWISLQTAQGSAGKNVRPPEDRNVSMALDVLVDFAEDTKVAGYRPGRLEVSDPALARYLSGLLADAGITVVQRALLPAVDEFLQVMYEEMHERPMAPGALEGKGVTVERMRAFADAAKTFYEAAPWGRLTVDDIIEIEAPPHRSDMNVTIVMGSGGMELGLGFCRDAAQLWAILEAESPEDVDLAGLWAFHFGDITVTPLADADLWLDHALPLADEEAYPYAMRYESRGRIRRPAADVLAFLEGLLRAIAASTEEELDSGRWTKRVATFDGETEYRLSLPLLLNPPDRKELMAHGHVPDARSMDQFHAQMDRFLEGKDVEDIGELHKLIEKEFVGKPLDPAKHPPRTPLERAQDLCYEAVDALGRRRVKLAREAIAISPDCADAWVILAEAEPDPEKTLDLYLRGVEAGRRTLGEKAFEEDAGHFWGITRTRPFMRALIGAAMTRQDLEMNEEAAGDFRELLRLDPGDHQGARYLLLPLLLEMGRDDEAESLLAEYKEDDRTQWAYARALLAFRREGDAAEARRLLSKAVKINPCVARYLLDEEEPPPIAPYTPGSEEEAASCFEACVNAWDATPGALDWMDERTEGLAEVHLNCDDEDDYDDDEDDDYDFEGDDYDDDEDDEQ
jgi:tetratricopeptide (TPR) repeat protein